MACICCNRSQVSAVLCTEDPGRFSNVCSCVLHFFSVENTERGPGPKSTHARGRHERESENGERDASLETQSEKPMEHNEPAHPYDQTGGATYEPAAPAAETPQPVHGKADEAADADAAAERTADADVEYYAGARQQSGWQQERSH